MLATTMITTKTIAAKTSKDINPTTMAAAKNNMAAAVPTMTASAKK